MKKAVGTFIFVLAIGIFAYQAAEAGPGWGRGYGPGGCRGYNAENGQGELDKEALEAREQFYEDTQELREQLYNKRNEYFEAMNQDPVDKDQAAQIWSEMFDLQTAMRNKASEAGLKPGLGWSDKATPRDGQPCGGPCWDDSSEEGSTED